jgi:hypothetical protein
MEHEIFTEAVPTAFIMTFLLVVRSYGSADVIIGEGRSEVLFFVSFTTSVLSAGLGLAKCLKVGPCRVLAEGGCLGGLLAPRFLLIFAACLLSPLGKGLALASPFASGYLTTEHKLLVTAIILATMFLPGFLLGLASCWHRGILKTFIAHPSIILMPTFTHFTFASSTKWCRRSSKKEEDPNKEEDGKQQENAGGEAEEEPFITFSAKFTFLNMGASVICHVIYCLSMIQMAGWGGREGGIPSFLYFYLHLGVPLCILGLLLTLLTLALTSTRQTCCSRPRLNCCCTCFTLPRVEYGALLPNSPHTFYVLENGKLVLGDEEVRSEDTEMVNNEKAKKIDNQDEETVDFK